MSPLAALPRLSSRKKERVANRRMGRGKSMQNQQSSFEIVHSCKHKEAKQTTQSATLQEDHLSQLVPCARLPSAVLLVIEYCKSFLVQHRPLLPSFYIPRIFLSYQDLFSGLCHTYSSPLHRAESRALYNRTSLSAVPSGAVAVIEEVTKGMDVFLVSQG